MQGSALSELSEEPGILRCTSGHPDKTHVSFKNRMGRASIHENVTMHQQWKPSALDGDNHEAGG
ncbi:protein of unknown function [Pseudomonas sp. JV551A1]|nr:protein of unknown function [Pseudomonas sp. JV551A1]